MRTETRRRLVEGSTLGLGVLLALALYGLVNYLSWRHYERFDWTSSGLYSLSEKSLAVARGVDRDVDLVIFLDPGSELYSAVDELASRYAAANDRIRKRVVDPAKNLLEAQRLVERYAIERENVVVVASGDDRRVIDEFDLAEYDYSGAQFGQGPTLEEFKGEQLLTSAILALVEARKPKVLFVTGHGESSLDPGDPRGLGQARDLLGRDNFDIDVWGSLGQNAVPEGTDLLVVAGPTTNFLPPELDLFSRYLDAGGRMLILLDPVFRPGTTELVDLGLENWLAGYGVAIRNDIVIDPSSELPFFGPETIFTDAYGSHPIVESLAQTRTRVLLPLARSVGRSDDAPGELEITELVETSPDAWAETDLADLENVGPDEADLSGPVPLGVAVSFAVEHDGDGAEEPVDGASEQGSLADEPSTDESGDEGTDDEARLVVFGDVDFATDSQVANAANGLLLLNSLNWLVKREQLIDVEGRRPEQTSLSLSSSELQQVYFLVLLLLPGLAVATGIWVYLRRRR